MIWCSRPSCSPESPGPMRACASSENSPPGSVSQGSRCVCVRGTKPASVNNSGFPADHPRSTLFTRRYSYLINDRIPESSLLMQLFQWDALTTFVRDTLGYRSLYRSACPTEAVMINFMHSDDVLPWHFDTNDGVLQQ